ncbi:zinc ribbon-containing protein [Georgenia sp. TF02-10]|uniref:zinc ribbon-containing protein n=1 Tax=Georgenia sp. TF02-10 TaxID=2917725 RepID=UPI001FA78290|nr:zinc ribbon-containing protein [Georgenia sp. TF02-10]UNX53544.1 zinc ribbon-containing protein [Georgenia sp. TF02-10]
MHWGRREEEATMAAHAGETAQKTGDFYCSKCDAKVHVTQGDKIPKCPNGHSEFGSRRNEPGNK